MRAFEFDAKPINMEIFCMRVEAGAWEVVEKVGDSVGFVVFTGADAEARAKAYAEVTKLREARSVLDAAPVDTNNLVTSDDIDLEDLF